jgi:hypothetical protein
MVIPATRDGKAYAWPSFCFPGAGHIIKQSGFRGAVASVRAWAHMLQSSIILSFVFLTGRTLRAGVWIEHPVTLWTLVMRWQGL